MWRQLGLSWATDVNPIVAKALRKLCPHVLLVAMLPMCHVPNHWDLFNFVTTSTSDKVLKVNLDTSLNFIQAPIVKKSTEQSKHTVFTFISQAKMWMIRHSVLLINVFWED